MWSFNINEEKKLLILKFSGTLTLNELSDILKAIYLKNDGENAFYKADVQIGHGYRFLNYDILGISLSWNQPNIPDVKDQITAELFYRFNMTAHLELTPSMQFISNPTFNPDDNSLFYFGMRGRITL